MTQPVDVSGITKEDLQGGKSHLIGVAFSRGLAMAYVARALPAGDPRVNVLALNQQLDTLGGHPAK